MKIRSLHGLTAAALAAALIVPAFAQDQTAPKAPVPQRERLARVAGQSLDLTDEQRAKIREFREARQVEQREFGDEMRRLQAEYRDLINEDTPDEARLFGLIDKMAGLRASRQKDALKQRQAWESIFTPEQLDRMRRARRAFPGFQGPAGRQAMRGRMGLMGPGLGRGGRPGLRPFGAGRGFGAGRMMRGRAWRNLR